MVIRFLASSLAIAALGACQHQHSAVPAVLIDSEPETLDALKAALSGAMQRAQIELGAGDPSQQSMVSVLPPPPTDLEGNSTARPTTFNLYIRGDSCFAVRDGSDEEIVLDNVACRPA